MVVVVEREVWRTYIPRPGRQIPGCSTRLRSRSRRPGCRRRTARCRRRTWSPTDSSRPGRALCRAPPCTSRWCRSSCWGIRWRRSCWCRSDRPIGASRGRRGPRRRGGRDPMCVVVLAPRPRTRPRRGGQRAGGGAARRTSWPRCGGRRRPRGRCGLLLLLVALGVVRARRRRGPRGRRRRRTRGGTLRPGPAASCGRPLAGGAAAAAQLGPRGPRFALRRGAIARAAAGACRGYV